LPLQPRSGRWNQHSFRFPFCGELFRSATEAELDAWVDTGFTGELVVPRAQITALGLPLGPAIKARLADGSEVELETYLCLLEWFGTWKAIETVAADGQNPLLGVGLLLGHELRIDYRARTMTLL
jgi:clan AA aspartic protease